ncbi:hypothetical protein N9878_01265 [bacterium]|nr:hypothetical protein [bacterium]
MTITLKQLKPLACHNRIVCVGCRTDADWRERVTGVRDFDCPHGVTEATIPSRGVGDTIAKITDKLGIKKCGGCAKRQAKANKLFPYKK